MHSSFRSLLPCGYCTKSLSLWRVCASPFFQGFHDGTVVAVAVAWNEIVESINRSVVRFGSIKSSSSMGYIGCCAALGIEIEIQRYGTEQNGQHKDKHRPALSTIDRFDVWITPKGTRGRCCLYALSTRRRSGGVGLGWVGLEWNRKNKHEHDHGTRTCGQHRPVRRLLTHQHHVPELNSKWNRGRPTDARLGTEQGIELERNKLALPKMVSVRLQTPDRNRDE